MKKFYIFLVGLLLMGFAGTTTYAESFTNGKATVTIFTEYNTKSLSDEQISELKEVGWQVNENGSMSISFPLRGKLNINGEEVIPNSDGTFYIKDSSDTIALQYGDTTIQLKKNSQGLYMYNQVLNWDTLWNLMDESEKLHKQNQFQGVTPITLKGFYDEYSEGDTVHCNRFNGGASDNVHYPKDDWRAYVNFVGSDCQQAITDNTYYAALCAKDYTDEKWCNGIGIAAACSSLIGHKTTYHKHGIF